MASLFIQEQISMRITVLSLVFIFNLFFISAFAKNYADIIVDCKGKGDYKSITEAIESLPMFNYGRTVIFVKNGIYEEKVRIEQNYITIKGESRDSTIIRYSQLREDWNRNRDYVGPAVVNLEGDDIILENLTIENSQAEVGPHAFTVYGLKPNRVIINNCNLLSKGGDTVSLWNYKNGMYYHANCYFQGAVDFVCPRGWCYIKDSKFYEVKKTAAIWHAGNYDPDQKFVLQNCSFDGVDGFELGRHHYEAQFYLLNCKFSDNMTDRKIYKVNDKNPDKNNPWYDGEREYYYNCSGEHKSYDWYRNNLDKALGNPKPDKITPSWTFRNKWDPESESSLHIIDFEIDSQSVILRFNEIVTVRDIPDFENKNGKKFSIKLQRFNDINRLTFLSDQKIVVDDLQGKMKLLKGDIIASIAYVKERSIGSTFYIEREEQDN